MMALPFNRVSGMPQIGAAFAGWLQVITIKKRNQTVVDALVTYGAPATWDGSGDADAWDVPGETYDKPLPPVTAITFKGTIQPLSPKLIALKPEGQRAWEWLQIHCFSGPLNLRNNDQIIYNGKDYKIMGINDYSLNGFIEYHAIEDYQDVANG